jgi:short-subunit dehydrogenase
LDIGVLVCNAGVGNIGPFVGWSDQLVQDVVAVNALHPIFTIKVLVDKLVDRFNKTGKKSAITITSSGLGKLPVSGFLPYSCSKSFSTFLARGLSIELDGKVDVLGYEAGMVVTKFIEGIKSKPDIQTISSEDAARCSLRDLGLTDVTSGHFKHELGNWQCMSMPDKLFGKIMLKASIDMLKKTQKVDEKDVSDDYYRVNEAK